MRLELTVPAELCGKTEMLDALDATEGSEKAKDLLRPILVIVSRAVSFAIQQEVFDNFKRYAHETTLPRQGPGDLRIALDLPDTVLDAVRGDLIDLAMEGSEWIWQTTADGRAAAVFEVLCDILDEGLPPGDQQALLNANLADVVR